MAGYEQFFKDKNSERYMIYGRVDMMIKHVREGHYVVDDEKLGDFYFTEGQQYNHTLKDAEWRKFGADERWGEKEYYCCFKHSFDIPERFKGQNVYYQVMPVERDWYHDTQFIVEVNGQILQGSDLNHQDVKLLDCAEGNEHFDIVLYAYSDDYTFRTKKVMGARLYVIDEMTKDLLYDLQAPLFTANCYDFDDDQRVYILKHLNEAVNLLEIDSPDEEVYKESVKKCRAYLDKHIYGKQTCEAVASCIGHTHIDVAWLWRIRQTREKAGRSFATVLKLMEEYPEYKFMSSQAQLYDFVKQDYPEVFERIKQAVKDGKWEVEGSMWVEPDTNVPSGESLVRQFLIGKRFFKEEFGVDTKIMWEPDTFGYSPVLPQIMKKSGVNYFMTTKLSWNEFNRVPYDTFMWRGIDGSEVLTHFSPSRPIDDKKGFQTTYSADLHPHDIIGGWRRYSQKDLNKNYLCTFGFGDGGGGATRDMLEYQRRIEKGIPGCPKTVLEPSIEFFKRLEKDTKNNRRLPTWVGELYFEFHRATLTSQAANKRNNRKIEIALHNLEALGVIANLESGSEYSKQELRDIWKKILTNQFHDILPGSSIRSVYEDSDKEYAELFEDINARIDNKLNAIVSKISSDKNSLIVFNTLGAKRDDIVFVEMPEIANFKIVDADGKEMKYQKTFDGKLCFLAKDVPAMGYKVFNIVEGEAKDFGKIYATNKVFRNKYIKAKFDKSMQIVSLYHKAAGREVVMPGGALNRLVCYDDRPHNHDAWDIKSFIEEKSWNVDNVVSSEIVENGAVRCVYKVVRKFRSTEFVEYIIAYADNDRIDVILDFDWKETRVLLRLENDVDINSDTATFDIQFGNVKRATHENTLWDFAQFETMGHKWIDLSDNGFGFSLINDSKYGHSIKDKKVRTSVVRSSMWPCTDQDKEHQHAEFSLYVHNGSVSQSNVIAQANSLNIPLICVATGKNKGNLDASYSFACVDKSNIIIDTVKMAEDTDETVVRLYETWNNKSKCTLSFNREIKKAYVTNLIEEVENELDVKNGKVELDFNPFEIKTIKVTF